MTTIRDDAAIIARFERDLMSGKVFRNHAASARSIIGYRPPCGHARYAKALAVLAKGAAMGDRQATLISAVVRALPLHQEDRQTVGAMYEAADKALSAGYFDTIGWASPEPGRYSDREDAYTLADRLTLLYTLTLAADAFIPGSGGLGWCASALVERDRVRLVVA